MSKTSSNRGSVTSVAALAVLGVGIYLGTKMKSPGPGGEEVSQSPNAATSPTAAVVQEDPPEQPPEPPLLPSGPPNMITVLIRDDGFVVSRPDEEGSLAMALPEVADLAATTTGTAEGIRVRIERHVTATAGSQQQLYQALAQVGVKPEQMQQISEFVE